MSGTRGTAAVVTVGSELTTGLRLDTNTQEICAALTLHGYMVIETVSVADDTERLSLAIERLTSANDLVIVTGGLGPTHDDITREATSRALGLGLAEDPAIRAQLETIAARHADPEAALQVFVQAQVLHGARVISPTTGTAPGQVIETDTCVLALLPGPPHEMRPMLADVLGTATGPQAHVIRCAGISESDAQVTALRVLAAHPGIDLTVLASPWLVDVVLPPAGADESALLQAGDEVADALGEWCFARDASTTLAGATVSALRERSLTVAGAESCTGGMIAAAFTDVAGA
ncbi:MAG: molybdopterin-binding protein, partial [Actinomycetota bacterium]|nr:molybdopterin-binding protein [Actinomycetota bacterium]